MLAQRREASTRQSSLGLSHCGMAIQKNMASAVSSCDEHITTIACFLPLQFEGCIPSLSNQQRHRRKCQGGWSWCAHTFEHSRTHSSTANSSSVSAVSHCLALVRFSCVMLERLPRVLPSATIELVDHRQGGAQHLVLEKSFRLGRRAGAAPRQWRRNRGLLYPAHLDMVTEDKATITLEKYIGRRCVATTGARSTAGRPSAAQRPGFVLSSCGRCCCMRTDTRTARRRAPSLL